MDHDKNKDIDTTFIKLGDLLRETPHLHTEPAREDIKTKVQIESLKLEIKEKEDVIKMRQEWSALFKLIVIVILIFEIGLTVFVGFGWLNFQDEWFLRIIIFGGFAQLLIMPYTVATFLFNKNSKLSN